MIRRLALAGWFVSLLAPAQDIDSVIATSGSNRSFRVLDQVEDRDERRLFLKLYGEKTTAARHALAIEFVKRFPQSWLLATVWEIAAKASMDMGAAADSIAEARQSLRLLPENPLLLVPLSSAQIKAGQLRQAAVSATDALRYLDFFSGPSGYKAKDWVIIERQLRGASHLTLARVAAADGFSAEGGKRDKLLDAAEEELLQAEAFDPEEPATAVLKKLIGRATRSAPSVIGPAAEGAKLADYAGSSACAACHKDEHRAWSHTGMSRMFRAYGREALAGDFKPQYIEDGGSPVARVGMDAKPYFDIAQPGGRWTRFPVDYLIGSKWQQAYATKMPNGEIHVIPLQYNLAQKRWVNFWKVIDPMDSPRAVVRNFPQLQPATDYFRNCAPCHTSQLSASNSTFREGGVNCEMCHGPSAAHVAKPAETPVRFRAVSAQQEITICSQCHRQSLLREPASIAQNAPQRASNVSFMPAYRSRPFTDFSRRAFYRDGRFRETTFIVEAFLRSACFRQGGARCTSCHSVHAADAETNPVSLKFRDNPDRMCLQCHQQFAEHVEEHTRHPAASEASRCVTCHMPRILNALLFKARTHQIDDVPNPEFTAQFGQEESPNACLDCHKSSNPQWVAQRLKSWRAGKNIIR